MTKTAPGNMKPVLRAIFFQSVPLKLLYRRVAEYPANKPMTTQSRNMAVINLPRFEAGWKESKASKDHGDKNHPKKLNTRSSINT